MRVPSRQACAVVAAWCATLAFVGAAAAQPSADRGRSLYNSFCARCHGVSMVTTGASFDLRTFPKDQRERFERSVTQGIRAMPAWGNTLTADELASLWLYVSTSPAP
jgi:cytochrome c55X